MNWIRKFTSNPKNAGLPEGDKANSSKSYTVIDKCDKCPVSVYEEAVFNDNLRALIVEGDPPNEVLVMAKMELVTEFAELSGNKQSSSLNNHIRQIYRYRGWMIGYTIAGHCVQAGRRDDAVAYLNDNGLFVRKDWDDETLIKKIISKIKNFEIRLSEELKRYEAALPKESEEIASGGYFTELLATLSKHMGFHVSKQLMMSELAAYIKNYQKELDYVIHSAKHRLPH